MEAPAPDWSELPADILCDVLTLLECPDLLRAGAVYAAWHMAYSRLRRAGIYPVRQTPCLLYCNEAAGGLNALGMYILSEKKAYTMPLPESSIKNWIGSSHGWLVTMDDKSELMLLNPITGNTNVLPRITTMEHVKPVLNGHGVLEKYEVFYYDREIPRVVEEDTAIWSLEEYGGCIVMLIHQPYGQLLFAKVGDDHWNWLSVCSYYKDCVYHNGWFYAVTEEGAIDAYNLHGPSVIHKRLLPQIIQTVSKCHVVRAQSGLLNPDHEQPGSREWVTEIKVYRIGDYALFIGSSTTSCLSVKDYPDLMPNHVYFTDDDDATHIFPRDDPPEVGIYDIKNNTRVNVVHPELWMNWLPPIWLTPSLAKTDMVVP
ncbi:hypothetical protein VPH35_124676 [Triticum aestivum]